MFLDIGVGILVSILASSSYGLELNLMLLVAGIAFALLPDIDFVRYFFLEDKMEGYKHRDFLHLPLLYIPFGAVAAYFLLGNTYAAMFALGSVLHFIHDSFGIGRGVKWLYPFSRSGYAFLYIYSGSVRRGLWKPLFVFDEAAIKSFDLEHGDREWLRNVYFRWHPLAIIEFSVFIISIIILYSYAR